ncbi:hypothetical protein BKN38_05440 [Helicobacter sp. CLO-3]|nr:hypothetical protein BA723_07150 [Helicobacter sp. CLO-3]OHU83333.1 hypothetical protein BKN38_05440 [Helicobacter sp. CLO-3]
MWLACFEIMICPYIFGMSLNAFESLKQKLFLKDIWAYCDFTLESCGAWIFKSAMEADYGQGRLLFFFGLIWSRF